MPVSESAVSVESTDRLPAHLNRLHTGIGLYHPRTGNIVDANERLATMYGYTIEQLREMDVDEYSANTYSFSRGEMVEHLRAVAEGETRQRRWRIKRADGELRWVTISLSPITLGRTRYVLAEVNDVTESVYDNRRVQLLTRIIRHNLRNDANVISSYAEHIEVSAEGADIRECAEQIRTKALEMGEITESVRQLEEAVTASDGRRSCRRARTVVTGVVERYRNRHPHAALTVDEQTQMWIHTDETFRYALSHAIENAIVHGTEEPHVDVQIDESPNTGRAEIRVLDDGPPIPEMEIEALEGTADTSETSHGSGVGLFVMKWCIESLGGELKIDRRQNDGNAVHLYLPSSAPPDG